MFELIRSLLSDLFFLVLHITGAGSFPKPLSRQEELACISACKAGDVTARTRLIEHNLRLVAPIINKG